VRRPKFVLARIPSEPNADVELRAGRKSKERQWAIVCTVHNLLKLALAKLAKRRSLSAALSPALAAR
jgi:hypothetical protein